MADNDLPAIFQQAEDRIRKTWYEGQWWFSVIDTVGLLTDSAAPAKYWTAMKARLTDEGFLEASTKCRQLKLTSKDGRMRETDCANTETLLRIVQSIPSPKQERQRELQPPLLSEDDGAREGEPE